MGEKSDLNWIEKLKRNSWEPEILISGIAIFALFRIPKLLDQFLAYFQANIYGRTLDMPNAVALFKVAIYWVILILIIHLVVRSIWIGMIGLSYIFPKEINYDKLKLSGKFENELKNIPDYKSIISKLENLCSALFSIAFLLLMVVVGAYVFFFVCMAPLFISSHFILENDPSQVSVIELIYLILIIVISIIAVIDFVSLGYFRRFKFISKIYFPIYKVVSILTLARFYRPIYYSFVTNYKKWKIILYLILFVYATNLQMIQLRDRVHPGDQFSRLSLYSHNGYNAYYDDQNSDRYSRRAHIQSEKIKDNSIRLFVVARVDIENDIRNYANYDSLLIANPNKEKYLIERQCISEFYHIYVDDSLIHNLKWLHDYKAHTKQKGYFTHINISNLPQGNHVLYIKGPDSYNRTIAGIPFYRE
ncbi:hypothetical protein [Maribellus mangrovi]|uniref:hypothetical protein n=1 Tax=Maribellus mangrovi TaxID=3133146 RepID=UPI0030EC3071